MFSLLHRYVLITALIIGFIGFTRVCVSAEYTFQGAPFSLLHGTRFSPSDSVSGSLSINNPPLGGACLGLGSGATNCDITALSLTASGSPPLTVDLSVLNSPTSAVADWSLSFDAGGNIVDYLMLVSDGLGTLENYIGVESGTNPAPAGSLVPDYILLGNDSRGNYAGGAGQTGGGHFLTGYNQQNAANAAGSGSPWTLVPEPSTAILFLLGGLSLAGACRRPR